MSSPTITPSTVDLCSLAQAKDWLGIDPGNTDDDSIIQSVISSFSQWVLTTTGMKSFNSVQNYTETYDGNGNMRLFLNNRPITNVTSVTIGSYAVPQSTSLTTPGWFIEQSGKSIAFRYSPNTLMPPQSLYPYFFTPGIGNIQIVYSAGYTRVPADLQEAVYKAVAIYYRRKDWLDMDSKALASGGGVTGTTKYRAWMLPPEIMLVINHYRRYARP